MTEDPFDEYLWDRSGEPDEQLRQLERLLARYRHTAPLPATLGGSAEHADPDPDA